MYSLGGKPVCVCVSVQIFAARFSRFHGKTVRSSKNHVFLDSLFKETTD